MDDLLTQAFETVGDALAGAIRRVLDFAVGALAVACLGLVFLGLV